MWNIWKQEIYKTASRKLLWLGLLLLLLFTGLRLYEERRHYSTQIDGQFYSGQEAIKKDQELTAAYAGILTEEKVKQIYQDFGFYYYDAQQDQMVGNYCSQYITRKMANYNQTDTGELEQLKFLEGDDWNHNAAPLLQSDVHFDYAYGWEDFKETFSFLMTMVLFVLFIIGISPVFSDEYMLKTADILLTTKRGAKSGIWMKITAALVLSAVIYTLFTAIIWFMYQSVYGTQGLDASAVMIGVPLQSYGLESILHFFVFAFFLGLAALLLLISMTLAISASCRNAFLTVIISIVLFLLPYAWMQAFSILLTPFLSTNLLKAISHFMVSMPFFLPINWGFTFSGGKILMHVGIAVGMTGFCAALGYWRYRKYQG